MPRDAWSQRESIGLAKVHRWTYPVIHELDDTLYAPARLRVKARDLRGLTLDTIGGVSSPAASPRGYLPRNLLGGLRDEPPGGRAALNLRLQYIRRARALALLSSSRFGYHGWENEVHATILLDALAARKVLGATIAQLEDETWFAKHRSRAEWALRHWLYDEGGDIHTGGRGRLCVRAAFDTPLQAWLCSLSLRRDRRRTGLLGEFVLDWQWVNMAGTVLLSRWFREAFLPGFESNSLSDVQLALAIDGSFASVDLSTAVDHALHLEDGAFVFEPLLPDVPHLVRDYEGEAAYASPAAPYAGKLAHAPSAWDLGDREVLAFDFRNVARRAPISFVDDRGRRQRGARLALETLDPPASAFPDRVKVLDHRVVIQGPVDLTNWSCRSEPRDWQALADATHPSGLLPRGLPRLSWRLAGPLPRGVKDTLREAPRTSVHKSREPAKTPEGTAAVTTRYQALPPFPDPDLPKPPAVSGRSLCCDLYSFLDIPLVHDRWAQYQENGFAQVSRRTPPVVVRTTPSFGTGSETEALSERSSGSRLRVTARNLPEISWAALGASPRRAGFLPHNLLGRLENSTPPGNALLEAHLRYGDRRREKSSGLLEAWGYYGWENYLDARLTLDYPAARRVLGLAAGEVSGFAERFAEYKPLLENAWRGFLYAEFRRLKPMPFFNYPLQVWAFELALVEATPAGFVLTLSVLNEALDAVLGRWLMETVLPAFERAYDDIHLRLRLTERGADLDLDLATYFDLYEDEDGTWIWEAGTGDDPALAFEYRVTTSPAYRYNAWNEVASEEDRYDYAPAAWNLGAGESLRFHLQESGLKPSYCEPEPGEVHGQPKLGKDGVLTFQGPLNLAAWSQKANTKDWRKRGGLLPWGCPFLQFQRRR